MSSLKEKVLAPISATIFLFDKNRSKGQHPNAQQLTDTVAGGIGKPLGDLSRLLPLRIKEIIKSSCSAMGWDIVVNRVKKGCTLEEESVYRNLIEMRDTIDNFSPPVQPTTDELRDIDLACRRLWELDINRVLPGQDYELDIQAGKSAFDGEDRASRSFFAFVDEKIFERPTYKAFIALLDNYISKEGTVESVTSAECKENSHFLSLCMDTSVMQYVHSYLVAQGKAPPDREKFIQKLSEIWFGLYRRVCDNDSSGFEHVFVGEIRDTEVCGLHNWIQMYLEEKRGNIDYQGYIKPKRSSGLGLPQSHDQFMTIQFMWKGYLKPESSLFVGTSPEFDMAFYSLLFLMGQEDNSVHCGPYYVFVKAFRQHYHGKEFVG